LWKGGKKLKVFIPIILVLFMLQSCGGSNIDPEEENGLEDVNPVVEEGEPDADDDDRRDDEIALDNVEEPDPDDEIEEGLDYNIGEGNEYEYEFE
jgi:hypothetical protein